METFVWGNLKYEDKLWINDNHKNENDHKNEDNPKKEDNLKNENNLKNKDDLKKNKRIREYYLKFFDDLSPQQPPDNWY